MTVTEERKLKEQQDEMMELHRSLEEAQTDFSYDERIYKAFERAMQFLDEEVAYKQYLLDTEVVKLLA